LAQERGIAAVLPPLLSLIVMMVVVMMFVVVMMIMIGLRPRGGGSKGDGGCQQHRSQDSLYHFVLLRDASGANRDQRCKIYYILNAPF
jgi:hypothetical protein